MKNTISHQDYLSFKREYEKVSGLELPLEYLENSDVYIFKKKGKIIGGFILGSNLPLRTIEKFISLNQRERLQAFFNKNNVCEVCCFWIQRKYRRQKIFNARVWLQMAFAVSKHSKKFILYGTNSKGLAKMYGYPEASHLMHKDEIENKNTYVFVALRSKFFLGTVEIILSKLLNRKRTFDFNNNVKNEFLYELSN